MWLFRVFILNASRMFLTTKTFLQIYSSNSNCKIISYNNNYKDNDIYNNNNNDEETWLFSFIYKENEIDCLLKKK